MVDRDLAALGGTTDPITQVHRLLTRVEVRVGVSLQLEDLHAGPHDQLARQGTEGDPDPVARVLVTVRTLDVVDTGGDQGQHPARVALTGWGDPLLSEVVLERAHERTGGGFGCPVDPHRLGPGLEFGCLLSGCLGCGDLSGVVLGLLDLGGGGGGGAGGTTGGVD